MHAYFLWSVRGQIARGDPDFTASYTAGRMLRLGQGSNLYEPSAQLRLQQQFSADSELRRGPLRYIHPPFEALLFVPFAFLPYADAFIAWDLANLCVVVVIARMLRPLFNAPGIRAWEILLALFAFFPIFANFFQGQDAILLLALVVLAFRALESRSDFMAGCWLGAGLFRYQIAIPLILILALWGRRRLVYGFLTASVAAFLLSIAIVGWHATLEYPAYVWQWASVSALGRTPARLLPDLLGLLTGWSHLENLQWPLRIALLVLSASLLVVVAGMKSLANDPGFFRLTFACAVITSLIVSFNTSTYDLCLLVLPLAMVGDHCFGELRGFRELRGSRGALVALVLPAVPLLVSPLWFLVGIKWQHFNLIAALLGWWLFAIRSHMLRGRASAEQPATLRPLT